MGTAIDREVVVEGGPVPGRRLIAVAGGAVRRESRFHVIRIPGVVEVLAVAVDAIRGQTLVDDVGVTGRASRRLVPPLQREARMVELRTLPGRRLIAVAGRAVRRESGCGVVRIGRPVVLPAVAAHAIRGQTLVDAVGVTGRASRRLVLPLQREARMVELRTLPGRRLIAVAGQAVRREPGCGVVRIGRPVVLAAVAADAIRGQTLEDAVGVAGRASRRLVPPLQREARMIELRTLPGRRLIAVAGQAVRREARFHVVRIPGVVEVLAVAAHAIRGQTLVDAVGVAGRASRRLVPPLQREARMIELRTLPGRRLVAVTGHAVRREARFHVVRIPGVVEVLAVAAHAI